MDISISQIVQTGTSVHARPEQPLAKNDFLRMYRILLGCEPLRSCIREELNSVIENINSVDADIGASQQIYCDDAINRCRRNEIFLGTGSNKKNMSSDEKTVFEALFPNLVTVALRFNPEVGILPQLIAGNSNNGQAFLAGRNNEGEMILMHQASEKETKEVMTLARATNAPIQLQQKRDSSHNITPHYLQPELISELQQRINPDLTQPTLSQQHPQYQNLPRQYQPQPNTIQQALNHQQQTPMNQQPLNSDEVAHERRFETRREIFIKSPAFCLVIRSELKSSLDHHYNVTKYEAEIAESKSLNQEENRAFHGIFPRILPAVIEFYKQGAQNPVWVMGNDRAETHFFVERKGDRVILTNRGDQLVILEDQLRLALLTQQPTQQFNLDQQRQIHQALHTPSLYSPPFNTQQQFQQNPATQQQSPNFQQYPAGYPPTAYPPSGYPPTSKSPTGY